MSGDCDHGFRIVIRMRVRSGFGMVAFLYSMSRSGPSVRTTFPMTMLLESLPLT